MSASSGWAEAAASTARPSTPGGLAAAQRFSYGAVTTQVIVLNAGSSSGKSGIARCLQAILPDLWLTVGVGALIRAMPASGLATPGLGRTSASRRGF